MAEIIKALEGANAEGDHELHTWCIIEPSTVQRAWLKKGVEVPSNVVSKITDEGTGRLFLNFSFVPWSKVAAERCTAGQHRNVIPQPLPLAAWARGAGGAGGDAPKGNERNQEQEQEQGQEQEEEEEEEEDSYSRAAGELWRSRRAEDVARARAWQEGVPPTAAAAAAEALASAVAAAAHTSGLSSGAHPPGQTRVFSPMFYPPEEPFRILCLDGGGVRGVLEAALLERLYVAFPTLIENVDLIAGTSTGGMLAGLLAAGYSPRHCKSIFAHHASDVFTSWPSRRYSMFNATYDAPAKQRVSGLQV
jgi:hypothetical protein